MSTPPTPAASATEPTLIVDDSHPGVRVLTMNRPERLNALHGPQIDLMIDALKSASDPGRDIRVIVLKANGRAFSAGADLKWLSSGVLADDKAHLEFQDRLQALCETIESLPQPVIAAVHGFALAGGMELTLSCDIVVVAENAELGDEHIRRNLLPGGGGSQRLPRKLGFARGMYHLLTGKRTSGTQAVEYGLAALAVPAAELAEAAVGMARDMAKTDAHALAMMKEMVRKGMEMPLKDGLWRERWMQHRYRAFSSAMDHGVANFAAQGKDAGRS